MIYITGDIHGDITRFKKVDRLHLNKKDVLFICGDFGFIWTGEKTELRNVKQIGNRKHTTIIVDGCHENHSLLAQYPVVNVLGGKARHISGNLYCACRGEVFQTLDKQRVFTFGGGDSTDISDGKVVEQQALPSLEEIENGNIRLREVGDKVDVIVTHDVPSRLKAFINMESNEMTHLHAFLEDICKSVDFKQWYFGKYHGSKRIPPCYNMVYDEVVAFKDEEMK